MDSSGKFGRTVIGEDGKLKTKAAPELLRAEMRALPGELVTKDVDDADRVHDLDAPHIREVLVEEAREASGEAVWAGEADAPPPPDAKPPQTPREAMANNPQLAVDVVRLRVLRAWASAETDQISGGRPTDMGFRYLWFPIPGDFDCYEWRKPPVPIDRDRPAHLRGLDLVVDLQNTALVKRIVHNLVEHFLPVDKRFLTATQNLLTPDAWMVQAAIQGQL